MLLISQIVPAAVEKEINSVGEEKVDRARFSQQIKELGFAGATDFWIQEEGTKLGNEKLQIRPLILVKKRI